MKHLTVLAGYVVALVLYILLMIYKLVPLLNSPDYRTIAMVLAVFFGLTILVGFFFTLQKVLFSTAKRQKKVQKKIDEEYD